MPSTLTPTAGAPFAPATTSWALIRSESGDTAVELADKPVTIGAGPRCTLRLSETGLRPLHCVVTPSPGGPPVVRRWAEGTLLNGEEFTEATLAVGDRLQIGGGEFTVAVLSDDATSAEELQAEATPSTTAVEEQLPVETDELPQAETEEPFSTPAVDPQPVEALEEIQAEVAALVEEQPPQESSFELEEAEAESDRFGAEASVIEQTQDEADEIAAESFESSSEPATSSPSAADWEPSNAEAQAEPAIDDAWELEGSSLEPTTVEPTDAPADDIWGVTTATDDTPVEPVVDEAEAVDAWEAEFAQPEAADPDAGFGDPFAPANADAIAAFSEETASEANDPEPETEPTSTAESVGAFETAEAIETPSPCDVPVEPVIDETEAVEAVDAWEAEFAQPEAADPDAGFNDPFAPADADAVAAFSEETAPKANDSEPESEPTSAVESVEAFEAAEPVERADTVEAVEAIEAPSSWPGRLASGRERVRRLTRALRDCRERIATLQSEVNDRDAAIEQFETRIAEVVEAADAAANRLSQLETTAEQLATAEQALEAANARIAELEQRLADLEQAAEAQAVAETPVDAVEQEPTLETPPGVEEVAQEAVEEVAPVWGEEDASVADEQAADPIPLTDEPAPSEEAWGIEQLADQMPDVETLWQPVVEEPVAEAEEEEAVEAPVEEPVAEEPSVEELSAVEELSVGEVDAEEPIAIEPEVTGLESELVDEVEDASLAVEEAEAVGEAASLEEEVDVEPAMPLAAFQPREETASDEQPVEQESFLEKYAHMLPEDDAPAEPITPVEPAPVAEAPSAEEGEDDSIDDYMRRLMQRVRGEDESSPASPAASAQEPVEVASPVAPAPAIEPQPQPEPVEPIKDLSELRRSPAVQPATDMGELRELANQSARNALSVAATKMDRERATLKLTVSAVAFGCGAMAAISATTALGLQFWGGLLAVSVGGWFGFRTLRTYATTNPAEHLSESLAG